MLAATKLGGGVIARKTDAAAGITDSDLFYAGISQPLTPFRWPARALTVG
jgi:hypothetical protein